MSQNYKITNIYDLGSNCSQGVTCDGYMIYVDCPPMISRGEEGCVSFYILDAYGSVVDTDTISDIALQFSNQYSCTTQFYGSMSVDTSDDIVEIHSMQKKLDGSVVSIGFTMEDTHIDTPFKSNAPLVEIEGDTMTQLAKFDEPSAVVKIRPIECNDNTNVLMHLVAAPGTHDLYVDINGMLRHYVITTTQPPYTPVELEMVFNAGEQSMSNITILGASSTSELYCTDIDIRSTIGYTNKGRFTFCISEKQTESLIRGDLHMSGWVVSNTGSKFSTGCTKVATIQ